MSHADTLRGMEKAFMMAGSYERAGTCLAGANALDTLGRVRAVLADLRDQQEAAWQAWDAYDDLWDRAAAETLNSSIHLLAEALEGGTE